MHDCGETEATVVGKEHETISGEDKAIQGVAVGVVLLVSVGILTRMSQDLVTIDVAKVIKEFINENYKN